MNKRVDERLMLNGPPTNGRKTLTEKRWEWDDENGFVVDEYNVRIATDLLPEDGKAIAAAPDMARRLLERVESCDACRGTGTQWARYDTERVAEECIVCSDDRAALKKAGVLP